MLYLLISVTVIAVSGVHLLLKQGLISIGQSPSNLAECIPFMLKFFTNPYCISAVFIDIISSANLGISHITGAAKLCISFCGFILRYSCSIFPAAIQRGCRCPALVRHHCNLYRRFSGSPELDNVK